MKNRSIGLTTLCLLAPFLAFAQGSSNGGNGGNAVICFDEAHKHLVPQLVKNSLRVGNTIPSDYIPFITSVEALDLYEAKRNIEKGDEIVIPALVKMKDGEKPKAFVDRLIRQYYSYGINLRQSFEGAQVTGSTLSDFKNANLTNLDLRPHKEFYIPSASLAAMIERGKHSLKQIVREKAGLPPARDIAPLIMAKEGCVYSTVAVQRSMGDPKARELAIDTRLFEIDQNRHSDLSKAVFYLHEYVLAADLSLRESKDQHQYTEGVRELVGALLKQSTTYADVIEIIRRRALFPMIYSLRSPLIFPIAINETLLNYRREWNRLYTNAVSTLGSQFIEDAKADYESLPRWLRKIVRLKIETEYRGNETAYSGFYNSSLTNKQFSHLTKILAIKEKYIGELIPNLIRSQLDFNARGKELQVILDPISKDTRMEKTFKSSFISDLLSSVQSNTPGVDNSFDEENRGFVLLNGYKISVDLRESAPPLRQIYMTMFGIDAKKVRINGDELFQ